MKIVTLPVSDLHPADYNPRKDLAPGDKQYEKLARSIETFGYVEPIVWNRTTGNIVGGHQRLKVLVQNGYTEVQVVEVELNEQEERILNVSLNKISGRWDNEKLTAQQIIARVAARTAPDRGNMVRLVADPANVHVFSTKSGLRIS